MRGRLNEGEERQMQTCVKDFMQWKPKFVKCVKLEQFQRSSESISREKELSTISV